MSIAIVVIGLSIGTAGISYYTFKSGSSGDIQSFARKQVGPWIVELKSNITNTMSHKCLPKIYQVSIARGLSSDHENLVVKKFNNGRDSYFGKFSAQLYDDRKRHSTTIRIEDKDQHAYYGEFILHV